MVRLGRFGKRAARVMTAGAFVFALLVSAPHALAAGVVGTGTPESCTEDALDAALTGGGVVTFNCGVGMTTIDISATKEPASDTFIDGDNDIILRAQNVTHFRVNEGVSLTLEGITLTDTGNGAGGAIHNEGKTTLEDVTIRGIRSGEGAVNNETDATLLVNHTTFVNNVSTGAGGAINNHGVLKIKSTTFLKNSATRDGGAIYSYGAPVFDIQQSSFVENTGKTGGAMIVFGASAKIKYSFFQGNKGGSAGGAIHNRGEMVLSNSTVMENQGDAGGGIINYGTLTVVNATILKNHASAGGGISNYRNLTMDRSTVSGNVATFTGGALFNSGHARIVNSTLSGNEGRTNFGTGAIDHNSSDLTLVFVTFASNKGSPGALDVSGGKVTVENTIFWKNGVTCKGQSFTSEGHNIADDRSCGSLSRPSDRQNTDAKLGPLASNGGPTLTHLPAGDSPALGWGAPIADIKTDQRGVKRSAKDPDIGAVEVK